MCQKSVNIQLNLLYCNTYPKEMQPRTVLIRIFSETYSKVVPWTINVRAPLFPLSHQKGKMSLLTVELRRLYNLYHTITFSPRPLPFTTDAEKNYDAIENVSSESSYWKWLPYILSRFAPLFNLAQYIIVWSSLLWIFLLSKTLPTFEFFGMLVWGLSIAMLYPSDSLLLGKQFRTNLAALVGECDRLWNTIAATHNRILGSIRKAKNFKFYRILLHMW